MVDDEEALLSSLASAARARGYTVETASNGSQGLERARACGYDLVVTDLRMPGLDGPAFIGSLREEGMPTRVVVITGYATLEAAVDCLRKGAIDFLIKPFEVEEFLDRIALALSKPHARVERTCDWEAVARRFGLTRRERQVLQVSYDTGTSAREMAEDLRLSVHTVKSHLKSAYHKLGVSTRGQLFRVVQETGG
ncbi:MAG: response regulator [Deltaproteobacteria bacterium]|nr:response regulator [Deltaproteobacteria bacterium]